MKKASQREETVAVCIVEQLHRESPSTYLLVQRPEKGLLASLWEFSQILIQDGDEVTNKMNEFLRRDLGLTFEVVQRVPLGKIVHLFSHIRQQLEVEWMQVTDCQQQNSKHNTKWLTEAELEGAAISKSVKKCFALVSQHKANTK